MLFYIFSDCSISLQFHEIVTGYKLSDFRVTFYSIFNITEFYSAMGFCMPSKMGNRFLTFKTLGNFHDILGKFYLYSTRNFGVQMYSTFNRRYDDVK